MTGPALYRYVGSRDKLVADLVVDAWEGLAAGLERAAREHARASAAERLGAIGDAYRAWARDQPHCYRLAIQTRLGWGELVAEQVIPVAQGAMTAILDALEGLPETRSKPKAELPRELRSELETWTDRVGGSKRPAVILLRGVLFWSRLHGLVSL